MADVSNLMQRALEAQRAGLARDAGRLYRQALAIAPNEPDALHMLGVLYYDQGRIADAAELVLRALDLTHWEHPAYVHNLGLVLAQACRDESAQDLEKGLARMQRLPPASRIASSTGQRVAVIVPCFNHQRYVRRALESVFAQSHRDIELVVIDDGSRDGSAEIARTTLTGSPFPYRFLERANRGAPATINEGIGLSSAPFINVLNSDDWFSPERIERMLDAVAGTGAEWGYSGVVLVDDADRVLEGAASERVRTTLMILDSGSEWPTAGFPFIFHNVAISSGNIFFSRELYNRIGEFRNLRYNHDWDFCLRAVQVSEPVFVPLKSYSYRFHDSNTISDASLGGGRQEAEEILKRYIQWATDEENSENPVAPTMHNWGMYLLSSMLGRGLAPLMEREFLRRMASRAPQIGPRHPVRVNA